jgi:hypothetical protein
MLTTTEPETNVEPSAPPRRHRRRWPWALIVLAAAVYAAPWILSINGVAQRVTESALPWLPPGSNIGKPSLGWMSPVHLAGLKFLDEHGRVLLECDHVTSQKSLWQMATSPNSPGGWVLEKPRAYLYVDPTGFSINPVIRKFLARKRRATPLNFDLSVEGGSIEVRDPEEKTLTTISDVRARYLNAALVRSFEAKGELTDGVQNGSIDLSGSWTTSDGGSWLPNATARGTINYLPLPLFEPWLRANSTVEDVAGGGELLIGIGSVPSEGDSGSVTAQVSFKPRDAMYRRLGEDKPGPVPPAEFVAGAQWDAKTERLTFENISGTAGLISLHGQGHIDQPERAGIVDLRATADQDLTGILDLLNPEVRRHITVKGLRVRNVAVTGALWPDRFVPRDSDEQAPPPATLAGDVTWTDAVFYGVRATPGAVTAAFQPNGIALWPREVRIGEGQLVSLPEIRLVENRQLVAPAGPMLVDVNMTPEMCREWLKFVSPVLADATTVDGKLTLIVESGTMPFANPNGAEIAGTVRIHSATVTPGPLARQAIDSAATLARLITKTQPEWAERDPQIQLPPQDIAFRMHDGRVYHKGLKFQAGDVLVTTRGSVGLDHTLDMLVEIPLPDAWLDRGPVVRSLRGEVVTIPLQGTLERPQVDGRAMAEWGKRIGVQAAGGLLQNLLEKGLDRAAEKAQRRRESREAP